VDGERGERNADADEDAQDRDEPEARGDLLVGLVEDYLHGPYRARGCAFAGCILRVSPGAWRASSHGAPVKVAEAVHLPGGCSAAKRASGRVSPMAVPEWLEPMAATLTQERFTAPGWVFERKVDGIRVLAFKEGAKVRLLSRNRLPQDHSYPSFVAAIAALPVQYAVFDGGATGAWHGQGEATYHLFDVPWWDGSDLTSEPLTERRRVLESLPLEPPLR